MQSVRGIPSSACGDVRIQVSAYYYRIHLFMESITDYCNVIITWQQRTNGYRIWVSCTECYGEGWQWVDKLENVCMPPVYSSRSSDAQGERFMYYPGHELPTFLHYCQSFKVNAMSFYKRHLRTEIFNFSSSDSPGCTQKLFEIPPPSVGRSLAVPKDPSKVREPL